MRIFAPSRWATLALAVWFGGLYCFLGCELGMRRAEAATHDGRRAADAAAPETASGDCDECCRKPGRSEPAGHPHGGAMQCCRALSSVSVEKSKLPKFTLAAFFTLALEQEPPAATQRHPQQAPFFHDASDAYLVLHILRI